MSACKLRVKYPLKIMKRIKFSIQKKQLEKQKNAKDDEEFNTAIPVVIVPKFSSANTLYRSTSSIDSELSSDFRKNFSPPLLSPVIKENKYKKFLQIAKYAENSIVKPVLPSIGILESSKIHSRDKCSILAQDFIRSYVLEQTQDIQAIIIQRAFRLAKTKRHYKKFIGLRISYHKRLQRMLLLVWRIALPHSPSTLRSVHQRIYPVAMCLQFFANGRDYSPFGYFYVSGQIYVPYGYTAQNIYTFIYLLNSVSMRRIFKLWGLTAHNRVAHRTTLSPTRFTGKKISAFGNIYIMFHMWYRYMKWHMLSKSKNKDVSSNHISLDCKEALVKWTVVEEFLNSKRKRKARSDQASLKRVMSKAIRALYNRSVESVSKANIVEQADMFRMRQLQHQAHRGWLRFIEIQQRMRQIRKDFFKAWYEFAYQYERRQTMIEFYKVREVRFFCQKIVNKWCLHANTLKTRRMRTRFLIQRSPSKALMIVFLFMDRYENFFQLLCWRSWMAFTRARRRWKLFSQWASNPNEDIEISHKFIIELKHYSEMRLVGRLVSTQAFFPRKLGFSIEFTLKEALQQSSMVEQEALMHWKFTTETSNALAHTTFTSDALIRAIVMRLHQARPMDTVAKIPKPKFSSAAFQTLLEKDKIEEILIENEHTFHFALSDKLRRDGTILNSLNVHQGALQFSKILPQFTVSNQLHITKIQSPDLLNYEQIILPPETEESVIFILKKLEESPPRLVSTFKKELENAFIKFDQKLRDPASNKAPKGGLLESMMHFANHAIALSKKLQVSIKNPLIVPFKNGQTPQRSPIIDDTSPFEDKSVFSFEAILNTLSRYGAEDIVQSIFKFLYSITNIHFSYNEILTSLSEEIEQPRRHSSRRNIRQILLELPDKDEPISALVYSVYTIHSSLKGSRLEQYCSEVPFENVYPINHEINIAARSKIWSALKKKFINIEIPKKGISKLPRDLSFSKLRTYSSNSLISEKLDEISSKDAYIACLVIPYIISSEMIPVFVTDELAVNTK